MYIQSATPCFSTKLKKLSTVLLIKWQNINLHNSTRNNLNREMIYRKLF